MVGYLLLAATVAAIMVVWSSKIDDDIFNNK